MSAAVRFGFLKDEAIFALPAYDFFMTGWGTAMISPFCFKTPLELPVRDLNSSMTGMSTVRRGYSWVVVFKRAPAAVPRKHTDELP